MSQEPVEQNHSAEQQSHGNVRRKPRWGRRLALLFFLILLAVAALVYFAPALASRPQALTWGLGKVNSQIGGTLELARLQLSWPGPQQLEGLRVQDRQGREVVSVKRLAYDGGLFGLVDYQQGLGRLLVEEPHLTLYVDRAGKLSLIDAFETGAKREPDSSPTRMPARWALELTDGAVELLTADGQPIGQVRIPNVSVEYGGKLLAGGDITGQMDLDRGAALLEKLTGSGAPLSGTLDFELRAETSGPEVKVAGTGSVRDLTIDVGRQTISEPRVSFELDAVLNQAAKTLHVARLALASGLLTLDLAGDVEAYDTAPVLDVSGSYSAQWEELLALAQRFAPELAGLVKLRGRTAGKLTLTGKLPGGAGPVDLSGLRAATTLSWEAAEIYGIELGPARLEPRLADGSLVLPKASISALGGRVNLAGRLDLTADEPVLRIGPRLAVLEKVPVSKELARELLSRINPIFLQLSRIEGQASLAVEQVALPLGEQLTQRGAGRGRLDLVNMQLGPDGLLADLLALGGLPQARDYAVVVSGLDFELRDGRIAYENFRLSFSEQFDLRFHGTVGLDDTLDLVVSVPVSAPLLQRLGVKGPVVEYAQRLTGSRIELPLAGTRFKPRLDLSKVDVQALVKQALEREAGGRLEGLLRQLGEKPDKKPKDKKSGKRGKSQRDKKKRKRPFPRP